MIDRYLVVEGGDGGLLAVYPSCEGNEGRRLAIAKQEEYAVDGVSTQVYHERHVLIKEAISWKRGR